MIVCCSSKWFETATKTKKIIWWDDFVLKVSNLLSDVHFCNISHRFSSHGGGCSISGDVGGRNFWLQPSFRCWTVGPPSNAQGYHIIPHLVIQPPSRLTQNPFSSTAKQPWLTKFEGPGQRPQLTQYYQQLSQSFNDLVSCRNWNMTWNPSWTPSLPAETMAQRCAGSACSTSERCRMLKTSSSLCVYPVGGPGHSLPHRSPQWLDFVWVGKGRVVCVCVCFPCIPLFSSTNIIFIIRTLTWSCCQWRCTFKSWYECTWCDKMRNLYSSEKHHNLSFPLTWHSIMYCVYKWYRYCT